LRKCVSWLGLGVCALASTATRAAAGSLAFTGALSIQTAVFPVPGMALPPVVVMGAGLAHVSATGERIQSLTLPESAFRAVHVVVPVTDPLANPIKGVQAKIHNAAGVFGGSPLAGAMPLHGVTKVCLFKVCQKATANLTIPFSGVVGAGGSVVGYPATTGRATTVVGAPWTDGTAAVGSLTEMGFAHGPASASSATAQTSGLAELVERAGGLDREAEWERVLSLREQQLLSIARILAGGPRVALVHELSTTLDPEHVAHVLSLLAKAEVAVVMVGQKMASDGFDAVLELELDGTWRLSPNRTTAEQGISKPPPG
jgi:hypothetical protein